MVRQHWRRRLLSTDLRAVMPEGTDVVLLDEVDSTMNEAARRAPPNRPTWIVAKRQTKARGRRGHSWHHPDGNFAGTWLIAPGRLASEVALTSFVAALALYEALAVYVDRERLALKWPNDVLLDQRKIAGILLESSGQGGVIDWLAVGIGVNLASAPSAMDLPDSAVPPISLAEAGPDPAIPLTPEELLSHLAEGMARWNRMLTDHGFDPLRRLWLQRAARLGETITARTSRDSWTGIFETVDESGHLVLRTAAGVQRIAAADIYF